MISAQYLGMPLEINDLDHENLDYFAYCAKHDFRLQRCAACKLLRYPPTTACPWCVGAEFGMGVGRGPRHRAFLHRGPSCHSAGFQAVHAISRAAGRTGHPERQADQGGGAPRDRQSGAAGRRARAEEPRSSGSASARRVRMVFTDVAPGLALPQWTIDETRGRRHAVEIPRVGEPGPRAAAAMACQSEVTHGHPDPSGPGRPRPRARGGDRRRGRRDRAHAAHPRGVAGATA